MIDRTQVPKPDNTVHTLKYKYCYTFNIKRTGTEKKNADNKQLMPVTLHVFDVASLA